MYCENLVAAAIADRDLVEDRVKFYKMNNTVLRLFLTESEMLRVDFNKMIGSNSISATKNCKRHISNIRKLLKEMSKICSYRKSAIEEKVQA
jgi:hypothetical protein